MNTTWRIWLAGFAGAFFAQLMVTGDVDALSTCQAALWGLLGWIVCELWDRWDGGEL